MLRSNYHLNQGVVGTRKASNKQTRHYDFQSSLVKQCIKDLKKGKTCICFNESQLKAITREVKCNYQETGWGAYQLSVLEN